MTVSITWITPLLAMMSVVTTLAPSTITPESVTVISISDPCTVVALSSSTTSAAVTLPATTW